MTTGVNRMIFRKIKSGISSLSREQIFIYLAGAVLLIIGISLIFIGTTINNYVSDSIENTGIMVLNGAPASSFIEPVMGLLASGYIVNMSPWVIRIISVLGVILAYIGLHMIIHCHKGVVLKELFTRAYWRHFDKGFRYKKIELKKK